MDQEGARSSILIETGSGRSFRLQGFNKVCAINVNDPSWGILLDKIGERR
jgi:hypothetical protein